MNSFFIPSTPIAISVKFPPYLAIPVEALPMSRRVMKGSVSESRVCTQSTRTDVCHLHVQVS